MTRRVVVTGAGGVSPLGSEWTEIAASLKAMENRIRRMDWDIYKDLNTRLGCPVEDFEVPAHYTRRQLRTMGRNARLAVRASELALESAGLLGDPIVQAGKMGIAYGSCSGSTDASRDFLRLLTDHSTDGMTATTSVRSMAYTAAINIGVFFGITGRIIPTPSACAAGSQGIGYAYESIKYGMQDLMLAGGSEELCPTQAATFDVLYATSTQNDSPEATPRPFDRDRDGLVIGEGACTLVLEEYEHARARGATILAEIVGYGTNANGTHVTNPNKETMGIAMDLALRNAGLQGSDIGYVNAHGTATDAGDIAESQATEHAVGRGVPISSLKSYMGHTLGACGALEAWATIMMLGEGWAAPTINLRNVDENCGDLDYIRDEVRALSLEFAMTNNFAFGGIHTSLIIKLGG